MAGSAWSPGGLVIRFQGRRPIVLCPQDPPITFGRAPDRTVQFGHDVVAGGPDLHVSRKVGSIRCVDNRWVVYNDSTTRPFDIIVRGVANPLPPRSSADSRSEWAISPPGLDIRVVAPSGRYLLSISLDDPRSPVSDLPGSGDTTLPLGEMSDHDRLLLAAKFLSGPTPGDAVGHREAAQYASDAVANGKQFTPRAVDNVVYRWCRRLQDLGVIDVSGRDNINQLGRQLLAWGFLRPEDCELLRARRREPGT